MVYPNLRAIYQNGTLKLLEPLKLPEGSAVQVSVQSIADSTANQIMQFAGAWQDMPEELFNELMSDVAQRREAAFSRRRA